MNCEKCGKPTEGEQTLCPECAAQDPGFQVTLPEEEVTPVAETPAEEIPAEETPVEEIPAEVPPVTEAPAPKKTKKGGLIALVCAVAVLALAAVAVLLNLDAVKNLWNSTFASPAAYMTSAEEAALGNLVDDFTDSYGQWLEQLKNPTNTNRKVTMDLEIGEKSLALLNASSETEEGKIDFSFLNDIRLEAQSSAADGTTARNLITLLLGDTKILTADYIVAGEQIYLALPEANPAYLQIPADGSTTLDFTALPDAESLNKVLRDYIPVLLEMLQQVEKEKTVLSLNGAEQSATALTATVTAKEFNRTFINLFKKLQGDQTAKSLLLTFAQAYTAQSGDDPAQRLEEAISDALDDMEASQLEIQEGDYLTYTAYVDSKGKVIGRELTIHYADSEQAAENLRYITVTADGVTHYSLSADEETVFDGKSSEGNGEFCFYTDGEVAFTLTVTGWERTDDTLKGTFVLTPAAEEDPDSLYTLLGGDPAIRLTLDLSKTNNALSFATMAGTEVVVGMDCQVVPGEALEVTVPTEAVDVQDAEQISAYAAELDLDAVLTNMEEAGMPTEVVQMVAYYLYSILYSLGG